MLSAPNEGLTLVEMIDGGKVLATSIDKDGKSVHSRNIILEGRCGSGRAGGFRSQMAVVVPSRVRFEFSYRPEDPKPPAPRVDSLSPVSSHSIDSYLAMTI